MADVPAFDDIPSFDDLPDAASPTRDAAVPAFDDIPAFDALPDTTSDGRPAPETAAGTALREAGHAAVPAGAGLVGAGLGGAAAGALGAGPVGAFVGGLGGMLLASYGAGKAQEAVLEGAGYDDRAQRQANEEAHPVAAFAGGLAPAVATMSPVVAGGKAAQVVQRGAGAVMMGGFEAGQEYLNEGDFDPAKTAAAAALGAVAPSVNRVGAKLVGAGERLVPGRPGRTANPAADQAHVDVADNVADVEVGNSSLAQSPHAATGDTTGNPQSAPERSARDYGKDKAPVSPEQDMLTQGHTDPATQAALEASSATPEAAPVADTAPAPAAPPAEPAAVAGPGPNAQKPRLSLKRRPQEAAPVEDAGVVRPELPAEPVVEAGFPKEGEPVAAGANDATPLPPGTPERAAKAIERSKAAEAEKAMPEFKGETPINDSVTPAQREAGNYPKARTHDFGKPQKIETHAGDTRRGKGPDGTEWEVKLPYDYGYFNKTKGADKDHIDFARPPADSPEAGNKFFVIDQKNAETGKFDEHKLFTYYKDEAAARKHYLEGFSDGKGEQRLGAITEVTRPELVKFLQKHTGKAATKPFGAMEETAPTAKKPVREREVFKDLVAKRPDMAEALANASDEQIEQAIAGKRVRKYGVGTGASAGYPVEGVLTAEGKPVTANTKAKAAERSAAHKKVVDWFQKSAPKGDNETKDQLIARLIKDTPDLSGWKPTHKPAEWMLAREAQQFIKKPTPAAEKKFREAERLLRGSPEDVEAYRGGNRVEADIARSRRSGDDAIASAEAKNVDLGRNTAEDEMIAAIDAKRGGKFDVPHEEAETMVKPVPIKSKADLKKLPRKTVDVTDSSLAKVDTKAISAKTLREAEAAKLAGKKSAQAAGVESEGAAAPVKQIKVTDKDEMAKYVAMLEKASSKKLGLDALPAEKEPAAPRKIKDLFDQFISDDRGSVGNENNRDIDADIKRWLNTGMSWLTLKRTQPKSYRAMELRSAHDEYVQSLSDDLHKLNKVDENFLQQNLQRLSKMPAELRDPKAMQKIYDARDKDSAHYPLPAGQTGSHIDNLPPKLKALYDEHLKPMFDENDEFVKAIRAIDPDRIGPDVGNHIARIVKGNKNDLLNRDTDPTQPTYNGIAMSAMSAKDRKFYALVGADGRRYVVSPNDKGFTKWDRYKRENIRDPNFEFEDGKVYEAGPNKYTMRQATRKEIEENALGDNKKPMRYYDNAGFSAAVSNTQLGNMMRHITELHRITETPQFKQLSTRNRAKADELDWKESNLPNMQGTFLHPELKAVFDDFAGHPQNSYRQLNSNITKLLFWMPTAHINNVGTHWFVGRGWDNFSPTKNFRMLVEDAPHAIKSVVNQDKFQFQLRENGVGTIYGSVLGRRPLEQFAKKLQMEIETEPSTWGPIADKLGVPLKGLGRAVYDRSSKIMWAANDVFLTQRVMELMRKEGFKDFSGKVDTPEYHDAMRKAIVEAERDIPNYRIPHNIVTRMGSNGDAWGRRFAQFMGDPALTAFGRYHHGMFNSYANIIKDAVGAHKELGDRVDAAGKLVAMGVLAMVIYPVLDMMAKFVTGNEEGKMARRGPITIPTHLKEAAEGKQDVASFARGSLTIPPLISGFLGLYNNKDFRDKPIVEPGDVRNAFHGSLPAAARVIAQPAEYVARNAISPYNTFSGAVQKGNKEGQNPAVSVGKAIRDQALDVKDPSRRAVRFEKMTPIRTDRDARSRFKQGGSGPIENLVNKATGYK